MKNLQKMLTQRSQKLEPETLLIALMLIILITAKIYESFL